MSDEDSESIKIDHLSEQIDSLRDEFHADLEDQKELFETKINAVHSDVKRINGSVGENRKRINDLEASNNRILGAAAAISFLISLVMKFLTG